MKDMSTPPEPVIPAGATAVAERPAAVAHEVTPWVTIVWDDPVNLMSYVTHVFVTYFKFDKPTAKRLMMQVHTEGKAVVSTGDRDKVEADVRRLHAAGLWATMQRDG